MVEPFTASRPTVQSSTTFGQSSNGSRRSSKARRGYLKAVAVYCTCCRRNHEGWAISSLVWGPIPHWARWRGARGSGWNQYSALCRADFVHDGIFRIDWVRTSDDAHRPVEKNFRGSDFG